VVELGLVEATRVLVPKLGLVQIGHTASVLNLQFKNAITMSDVPQTLKHT
jgi:hypothetical protein